MPTSTLCSEIGTCETWRYIEKFKPFHMNNDNFEKQVSVNISLGHILAIWSVISDKLSCEPINKSFSEKEKEQSGL